MMDDELLKLECLKMARETGSYGSDLTTEAQRLFDFLKGRGQNEVKDGDRLFKDYIRA
jgi:hypothetical protein